MAETLTVRVEGAASVNVDVRGVTLFTDAGLTTPATFPADLSADTSWYAAEPPVGARHFTVTVTLPDGTVTMPNISFQSLPLTIDALEGRASGVDGTATGGGSSHSPILRAFPFTFNTPNLLTGAVVWTPAVGDILLDAWIEVDTAWDGTTPLGDYGNLTDDGYGLADDFGYGPTDMTSADGGAGGYAASGVNVPQLSMQSVSGGSPVTGRVAPGRITTADPFKIVVSQNGRNGGADPGSTQGAATLYLFTCTPLSADPNP